MWRDREQYPCTLYVSGFGGSVVEGDLEELFGRYGEVVGCKICRDSLTYNSRGFGFVTLINGEIAEGAIEALNGVIWKRHYLKVKIAKKDQ